MSAFRTIRSVMIEEMLHLCLARNPLVAIGGGDQIRFYDRVFVRLPAADAASRAGAHAGLEPCSATLMQDVLSSCRSRSRPSQRPRRSPIITTPLGQSYAAIEDGFEYLDGEQLWRDPHTNLQYARGIGTTTAAARRSSCPT